MKHRRPYGTNIFISKNLINSAGVYHLYLKICRVGKEIAMTEIPLNKAYIKVRPERVAIDRFKANFITLLDGIRNNPTETEEFLKNLFSDFLKNTWYAPDYFINTHQKVDLVIHTRSDTSPR
jgi:hypothetical protein